jgi:hypothetical protein
MRRLAAQEESSMMSYHEITDETLFPVTVEVPIMEYDALAASCERCRHPVTTTST